MTTPDATSLCADPGELIAAIPALLRFAPTDSLVLITYIGARSLTINSIARLDLPRPEDVADFAQQLRVVLANGQVSVVEVVVLGGGVDDQAEPPHRQVVGQLQDAISDVGVSTHHAVWAPSTQPGQKWLSYTDSNRGGQVADPSMLPFVDEITLESGGTFASRADLAAVLAPDQPDALARRAELLDLMPAADPGCERPFIVEILDELAAPHAALALDHETVVRLANALSHPDVREFCLAQSVTHRAPAAERLWTALTRATPGPRRAEPAALLAVCAYLRGDGSLAGVALDAALTAYPDHPLATTIRQAMDVGLTPHTMRELLTDSILATAAGRP